MPPGVKTIGSEFRCNQYQGCTSLISTAAESLPAGVTTINGEFRYNQYSGCTSLTTAGTESLPAGVTSVGNNFRNSQYYGCTSLTTPATESFPIGVATIRANFRSNQYSGCTSLPTAAAELLPAGVISIGENYRIGQYNGCTSLVTAAAESIPAGVTTIGYYFRLYQYRGCTSLLTAATESLPVGVTVLTYFRMGQYQDCTSLTTAAAEIIPAGVTIIDSQFRRSQYQGCTSLLAAAAENLPAGVNEIRSNFRTDQYNGCTSLTTAAAESIPAGLTITTANFRDSQYRGCESLTSAATFVDQVNTSSLPASYRANQYAGIDLSNGPKITRNGKEVTKVYVGDELSVGNLLFPIDKMWSDGDTRVWPDASVAWSTGSGVSQGSESGGKYTVKATDVSADISVNLLATASSSANNYYTQGTFSNSNVIEGLNVVDENAYSIVATSPSHGQITTDVDKAVLDDTVTISVIPDAGYTANTAGLAVTGGISTTDIGNGQFTFTMPNNNVTISGVSFTANSYSLSLDDSVQHGTVGVSGGIIGSNATDTIVTINANQAAGYTTGWLYYYDVADPSNKIYLTNNATSFKMPAFNIKVGATFTPASHNIAIEGNLTGGAVDISPSTRTTALTDALVKLTITPEEGNKISTLYYKETSNLANITPLNVNATSFVMPAYNVTVGATFEEIVADVPNISTQPEGYSKGTTESATPLTVTASVGSGTLSYQWYKSSTYGTDVSEATTVGTNTNSYTPEKILGNTYYFVIVTNTLIEDTSQTVSDLALVTWISNSAEISSYFLGGVTDGTLGTPDSTYNGVGIAAGSVELSLAQATNANFTATPLDGAALKFAYTETDVEPTFAKWDKTAQTVADNSYVWIQVTSADGNTTKIYKIKVTVRLSSAATILSFKLSNVIGSRGTPGATWDAGELVAGSVTLAVAQANPASTFTAVKSDSTSTVSYAYTANGTTEPTFGTWTETNIVDNGYVWIKAVAQDTTTLIYKIKVTVTDNITVTVTSLTANGSANATTTTELKLTLNKAPVGFTNDNISVSGATKGTATNVGAVWTIPISNITVAEGANVTVTLTNPDGYSITPLVNNVAIHKLTQSGKIAVSGVTINGAISYTHYYKASGANKTLAHAATVSPANASVKSVTWTSDDTNIATVHPTTGLVTFKGVEGTVKITVKSVDNPAKTHTKTIKVVKNVTNLRMPLTTVYLQQKKTLTIPVVADDGSVAVASALKYKSSNTKILTVSSSGVIKSVAAVKKATKVIVTVTAANGTSAKVSVYVVPKALASKGHTVSGAPAKLQAGKTAQLKIKLKTAKATNLKVTYTSSNKKILTVDKAGRIKAVKEGKALVKVKVGSNTVNTKNIQVMAPVSKLKVANTKVSVNNGKTLALKVTAVNAAGKSITAAKTWTSSNKKIVTVDKNGKIKGIKKGTAKITAKSLNGKKIVITVTVK
jgi:uncharacterized protein YjdB